MRFVNDDAVFFELDNARSLEQDVLGPSRNERIDRGDGLILPALLSSESACDRPCESLGRLLRATHRNDRSPQRCDGPVAFVLSDGDDAVIGGEFGEQGLDCLCSSETETDNDNVLVFSSHHMRGTMRVQKGGRERRAAKSRPTFCA